MKEKIFLHIDKISKELINLSDTIFNFSEVGCQEFQSSEVLSKYLEKNGFKVQLGIGGHRTSFRAEYESIPGGPSIGLLCEYDALFGIGHACGHNMQGPCAVGAAIAIKNTLSDKYPFKIVVYGCPDEEGYGQSGGKIKMIENGCFNDIDVAMIMHGGTETTTDLKTLAAMHYKIAFSSSKKDSEYFNNNLTERELDTMLISFLGIEFLREHMADDARIHYTYLFNNNTDINQKIIADFIVRSKNLIYLEDLKKRFKNIINGASLMFSTSADITEGKQYAPKIPITALVDSFYENAKIAGAQRIEGARKRVGSSDSGNVSYKLPGIGIRIAFAPKETSVHSKDWLMLGKSESAHSAVKVGAKVLAGMAYDFISDPKLIDTAKKQHKIELEILNNDNNISDNTTKEEQNEKNNTSLLNRDLINKMALSKKVFVKMRFTGKSSHAAATPDMGRSAFDGLQLAIASSEYIKKHLAFDFNMKYVINSSGGTPCNVVPDSSEGTFEISAEKKDQLLFLITKLEEIAKGVAMMSGTQYEVELL